MDIRHIDENMGNVDRVFRASLAFTFVAAYFNYVITGATGIVLLAVSVPFLVTAIFGNCPLYSVLGLRSKVKNLSH